MLAAVENLIAGPAAPLARRAPKRFEQLLKLRELLREEARAPSEKSWQRLQKPLQKLLVWQLELLDKDLKRRQAALQKTAASATTSQGGGEELEAVSRSRDLVEAVQGAVQARSSADLQRLRTAARKAEQAWQRLQPQPQPQPRAPVLRPLPPPVPADQACLRRARSLRARGQLRRAEAAFLEAIRSNPRRIEAWVELVELERRAGAHPAAERNLAEALRFFPGHAALQALVRDPKAPGQKRIAAGKAGALRG